VDTKSQEVGHEVLGVGLDAKSKGQMQSPNVKGQIPKACARSQGLDMKGTRTQLGEQSPRGGHKVPRGWVRSPRGWMQIPNVGHEVQRSRVKSQRCVQEAKGQMQRGPGLDRDGQGLAGAAQNRPGIDEGVKGIVRERVQGPKGVPRPERDIYMKIHGASASLWESTS